MPVSTTSGPTSINPLLPMISFTRAGTLPGNGFPHGGGGLLPLYAARISRISARGDFLKIDCVACHYVAL